MGRPCLFSSMAPASSSWTMLAMLAPAALAASMALYSTSSPSIIKRVMGWRMMEYKAMRMGRGRKLQRQPLMGLTPSSA